jgi:DNA polymerase-3 subunit delta
MEKSKKSAGKSADAVDKFRRDISEGAPGTLYILHGEERYLRDRTLESLRAILPGGSSDFNYRRLEWKRAAADDIYAAVNTPPASCERTIVEVRDFDLFGASETDRRTLCDIFSDMPGYVCLVFVYDTADYKSDGRMEIARAIKKYAQVVEFGPQDAPRLSKWVTTHFRRLGKNISGGDALYLIGQTDGYMASLSGEIGKLAAYVAGETITRRDIDAVVAPTPDAAAFQLTDAIARGNYNTAAEKLDALLRMREPPHKLIYIISMKMRQLLTARLCLDRGLGADKLAEICGVKQEFQARNLLAAARAIPLEECRCAVLYCARTAYAMNSGGDYEAELIKLLPRLALRRLARTRE